MKNAISKWNSISLVKRLMHRYHSRPGRSTGISNLDSGQLVRRSIEGGSSDPGILPCYERSVPHGGRPEDEYEVYRCPLPAG